MPVSTVEACKIANFDRQRFNEYVASGDYPCAPPTIPGKARKFDVNDIICLYVFAREVEGRTKAINAGMIANAVAHTLADDPDAAVCTLAKLSNGRPICAVPPATLITAEIQGAWIVSLTTINLAAIRRVVAAQMAEDTETGEWIG